MIRLRLPADVVTAIATACGRAGRLETGGMLFGEHMAPNDFRVVEATVAGTGTIASFIRSVVDSLSLLERYFRRTKRDYRRFNYLGEWHSHPSFALFPSRADDETMFEIVNDETTGALFAISMIVKLVDGRLEAAAFAYFPPGIRENVTLEYC